MAGMLTAADERARLSSLHRLDILDTPREQRFDDIVEIASHICGTPIAIVNLVDEDRQWGKAHVGVDDSEAPREDSFCARAIESTDEVFVVPDTLRDSRFAHNPMVQGDPHLRFYAGAPIVDREGHKLGSVCVADRRPRELSPGQLSALQALARQAMDQMELRLALNAELEHVQKLRELERARDQFVSTVSHELRSPLTAIRGWLDVLLEDSDQLDEGHREVIVRLSRNADRLTRVVVDLLDFTRVGAGDLHMRFEPVDLSALVRYAVDETQAGGRCGNLTMGASIAEGVVVEGDAERLGQVIDNLCGNAVKYTPDGGTVSVSLEASDGFAVLRVVDSGIGIPTAEREHLFQPFFRASTATEADLPGTGLGLALSKAIVERHRGTIAVADGDRGGVAFAVTLPLA
jgi:signal transduction histidine kinase